MKREEMARVGSAGTLAELQSWYSSQCNGDWEHQAGIEIETLDNPGWRLSIDLEGTDLEGVPFDAVESLAPTRSWIRCWVKERKFEGAGGPQMLESMMRIFLDWAAQSHPRP